MFCVCCQCFAVNNVSFRVSTSLCTWNIAAPSHEDTVIKFMCATSNRARVNNCPMCQGRSNSIQATKHFCTDTTATTCNENLNYRPTFFKYFGCHFIGRGHDLPHWMHLENRDLQIWYELFKIRTRWFISLKRKFIPMIFIGYCTWHWLSVGLYLNGASLLPTQLTIVLVGCIVKLQSWQNRLWRVPSHANSCNCQILIKANISRHFQNQYCHISGEIALGYE